MMYIHGSNKTHKRTNVYKQANTSTMGDNSTAAGCNEVTFCVEWDVKQQMNQSDVAMMR